jgi:hypothetical protein
LFFITEVESVYCEVRTESFVTGISGSSPEFDGAIQVQTLNRLMETNSFGYK